MNILYLKLDLFINFMKMSTDVYRKSLNQMLMMTTIRFTILPLEVDID